jgi:aspartyl/asparaginyl beta-hydroxylase (cupin superfamily)
VNIADDIEFFWKESPMSEVIGFGMNAMLRRLGRRLSLYNLAGLANPLFDLAAGGNRRAVFYDIDQELPELRRLDSSFEMIRAEYDHVAAVFDRLPPYHMIDSDVIHSSGRYQREKRWSVFMLRCLHLTPSAARELCPDTVALLNGIPGVYQAFFSVLEPGKSIPAHIGPSRMFLRYHLGLRVPTDLPPVLRVKDQRYVWREGESMLFDDSWDHEVINDCPELRAVLIVDVARPLPAPLRPLSWLLERIAGAIYAPRVVKRMEAMTAPMLRRQK